MLIHISYLSVTFPSKTITVASIVAHTIGPEVLELYVQLT